MKNKYYNTCIQNLLLLWLTIPLFSINHLYAEDDDGLAVTTFKSVGINKSPINSLVSKIKRNKYTNVQALLIAHKDKLLFEGYYNGWRKNQAHPLRSAGKSLLSAGVGIAIDQGIISGTDLSVSGIFERSFGALKNPHPNKTDIKLHNLLTMTAGLECGPMMDKDDPCGIKLFKSKQPSMTYLGRPMTSIPGELFNYTDAAPILVSTLLSGLTKTPFETFINEKLFAPMQFHKNSNSNALVARDFLKFGMLFLNHGQWNKQQIISKQWIDHSTQIQYQFKNPSSFAKGYGYYWWLTEFKYKNHTHEGFMAAGNGGQFCIVIPDLNLVFVTYASNYNKPNKHQQPLLMMNHILQAIYEQD